MTGRLPVIAVLGGTGAEGSGLATRWAGAGYRVLVGSRSAERAAAFAAEIGAEGPLGRLLVRGEPGWDFVPELLPEHDEIIIDKPGTGAFHGTDLQHILMTAGIENLILTGVTTGVCVTSTAREAADRGFNVLVLSDCCAEPDKDNHDSAMRLLMIEGGYIATVGQASNFLSFMNDQQASISFREMRQL